MLDRPDGHQRLRILHRRAVDDLVGRAVFDGPPAAQHHDLVSHLRHHGKVMRDVKGPHAGIADRFLDGGEDFDLGGHVQCGGGFVEHHKVGLGAQGHRGHHPLQLAARHLMRIALPDGFRCGQAQTAKEGDRPRLCLGPRRQTVQKRGLDHLIHQGQGGVESRCRRLRDIGHFAAAQGLQAARAAFQDVAPVQEHLAPGDPHAAPTVSHGGQPDGRLACPAFADQAHHLAAFKRQRHAMHQRDLAGCFAGGIRRRLDHQIADIQKRAGFQISRRISHRISQLVSHCAPPSDWRCGSTPSPQPD